MVSGVKEGLSKGRLKDIEKEKNQADPIKAVLIEAYIKTTPTKKENGTKARQDSCLYTGSNQICQCSNTINKRGRKPCLKCKNITKTPRISGPVLKEPTYN